jgi:hypothetical protein
VGKREPLGSLKCQHQPQRAHPLWLHFQAERACLKLEVLKPPQCRRAGLRIYRIPDELPRTGDWHAAASGPHLPLHRAPADFGSHAIGSDLLLFVTCT